MGKDKRKKGRPEVTEDSYLRSIILQRELRGYETTPETAKLIAKELEGRNPKSKKRDSENER